MRYKFFKHTADVKFRAYGNSLNEMFENSALAMIKSMVDSKIDKKIKKKIFVEGSDLENLLYNFLEKILVLIDADDFIVSHANVKIDKSKKKLVAELYGDETFDYEISHVKAVTYNEMFVKKNVNWVCQIVLDV